MRAHGGGLRACEAYGRAVVKEIRGAAEGERIVSGLFPEEFEEVDRLTMGEDVQHRAALFCAPSRVIFLYFVPIWCFPMVLAFWFILICDGLYWKPATRN